jgi:hypothetical protein
MSQLKKNGMNISTPTTTTMPPVHHHHSIGSGESPFPNYREINLTGQSSSGVKRNAQSVEGKGTTSSETQEVYMSLDRKSAKKQFIELSNNSAKRENNFNKIPTA